MLHAINHTISEQTRGEVIDLLNQASAKLGIPPNLPIASRNHQNMGQASKGFVSDCISAATAHPKVPSGEIDVKAMVESSLLADSLDSVLEVALPLAGMALNLRRLCGQNQMFDSNSIMKSFGEQAKVRSELKPVSLRLKQRYARAKKEDKQAEQQSPKASGLAVAAANGVMS